jgi:hypothetical protein
MMSDQLSVILLDGKSLQPNCRGRGLRDVGPFCRVAIVSETGKVVYEN